MDTRMNLKLINIFNQYVLQFIFQFKNNMYYKNVTLIIVYIVIMNIVLLYTL